MKTKQKGFTLLEILLVITLIVILVAIVIIAINPAKQIGEANNLQRGADVNTILNAVYQYTIDNGGQLPTVITQDNCPGASTNEICKTGSSCIGFTDLSILTNNDLYLVSMPTDPFTVTADIGTGYFITKSANNRVTVCAPDAQLNETINVTR